MTVDQTEPHALIQVQGEPQKTRVDFYAEQLGKVAVTILQYTCIGVFDGFYAKQKFVDKTVELGFVMISRLRQDVNLKHLYQGAQKPRARRRKFGDKVNFLDLEKFTAEITELQNQELKLYSAKVYAPSLKREIKLVRVIFKNKSINLFSTDLKMSGTDIFRFYRSRFSIEFLIRDARAVRRLK